MLARWFMGQDVSQEEKELVCKLYNTSIDYLTQDLDYFK